MILTKRNHYNPCFWTAHWNPDYYRLAISGTDQVSEARTQRVYVLNVKSGEIYPSTVDNVHFDKHLGVAKISREAAEEFAYRYYPDRYEKFLRDNEQAEYPIYIDFEQILTMIEKLPPYQVLIDVIRRGRTQSPEEKAYLGCFIIFQLLRSHAIMNSMIEWHRELQHQKFEHFVTLKWLLGDPEAVFSLVRPLVASQWTFFATAADTFPLCDSSILTKPHSIMVALSPRLLLEIQPRIRAGEDEWRVRRTIKRGKVAEFRQRAIGNTFREIIFGNPTVLEYWQGTTEFRTRVALMKDVKSYNRLVKAEGSKELWQINAYGNKW